MSRTEQSPGSSNFQRLAEEQPTSVLREIVQFLRANRKWWLTPVIAAVLLLGVLVFLAGTAAAPFIYTLF
jgi:hypothetical protein